MKSDYKTIKENYMKTFSYRFFGFNFKKEDLIDSIYFEIYKQTRVIYKSIGRFIRRRLIKKHNNCIKIFNKANQSGNVCPHALAFILWKMECEEIDAFWKMEDRVKSSNSYNFECVREWFSSFPKGAFMSHLDEILNSIFRKNEFDFNISSIRYIVNRISSHLLIERYIKSLEVVQYHDNIPMYIVKIPLDKREEISFYYSKYQIKYMKELIEDIGKRKRCPYKRNKSYQPFKSPIRVALDNMSR